MTETLSFGEIVESAIIPLMENLCRKAMKEKEALVVQGQKAFGDHVPFAAGTLLKAYTTLLLRSPDRIRDDKTVKSLRELLGFALTFKADTFGIMNLLISLRMWQKAGFLDEVLEELDRAEIVSRLNWRVFVDDQTLGLREGLPFNYYSVAYRVAMLRESLGWEEEGMSERFLGIYLNHALQYSLDGLFMDETMGEGRFDRYTTIVPAELAQICQFLDKPVPFNVQTMLRKSCDIYLHMANSEGFGYGYGRSLGAHGDTGALEVLPVAAALGLLEEDELALAYDYTLNCARRITGFWIDKETGLVNMWDKGRKIDDYRNKKRIFEVNLDISMKLFDALEDWRSVGLGDISLSTDFESGLDQMPGMALHFFQKVEAERALAVVRQGNHVFHLPLISGGHKYYDQASYLPLPYEPFLIEGSPDVKIPYLIPRLVMKNGGKLMPLAYFNNISGNSDGDRHFISYETEGMAECGLDKPKMTNGISSCISYTFEPGFVIREEEFSGPLLSDVSSVELEFCTFSDGESGAGRKVSFTSGRVKSFETNMELADLCNVESDPDYHTPNGPMKQTLKYRLEPPGTEIISIRWEISYT